MRSQYTNQIKNVEEKKTKKKHESQSLMLRSKKYQSINYL